MQATETGLLDELAVLEASIQALSEQRVGLSAQLGQLTREKERVQTNLGHLWGTGEPEENSPKCGCC